MMTSINTETAIQGIVDWWALAGVDVACGEVPLDPFSISAPQTTPPTKDRPASVPAIAHVARMPVQPPAPTESLPDSIEAFRARLASDQSLPGSGYSRYRVSPVGNPAARLVVITDLPEIEDVEGKALFAGRAGQLLSAMLQSIGLARDEVYIAPLAVSRPPSGMLPGEDSAALAGLMRHHLSLLKANRLLLLGNSVAQIMTGRDLFDARGILHDINHRGGKVAGVTTFHPRTMLASHAFKTQCWLDLQQLMKDLSQ